MIFLWTIVMVEAWAIVGIATLSATEIVLPQRNWHDDRGVIVWVWPVIAPLLILLWVVLAANKLGDHR